jgi:hypothetical protein
MTALNRGATLSGAYRLTRIDRATGEIIERTPWRRNAIMIGGKRQMADLIMGANSIFYNQANSRLRIYTSGTFGTLAKTITGADAAPDHGFSREVTWTWSDISADVYTAHSVRFDNGTHLFSEASPNFGAKPNSENWIYSYRLQLNPESGQAIKFDENPSGTPTNPAPGLDDFLRCMTGNVSGASRWNASLTRMEVDNGSGSSLDTVAVITGPSRSDSSGQVTITWVFEVGTGAGNFNWVNLRVYNDRNPTKLTLRYHEDNLGSKSSSTVRQWTYNFRFQ